MWNSRAVYLAVGAALALVVLATVPPVQAADDYSPMAGQWSGYMVFPGGGSDVSEWTFDDTGRYSVQWGVHSFEGNLVRSGDSYQYTFEWEGAPYYGVIAPQTTKGGDRVLVGAGHAPNGPVNFVLHRRGARPQSDHASAAPGRSSLLPARAASLAQPSSTS